MKSIRNSLVTAVLATALSGCGAPALYRVTQGDVPEPSEKFVLNNQTVYDTNYSDEICDLEITFTPHSYMIECSGKGYFYHGEGSHEHLRWDSVNYRNENRNSDVDFFDVNGINISANNNADINSIYNRILSGLRKNYVERIWRERYWRDCDE